MKNSKKSLSKPNSRRRFLGNVAASVLVSQGCSGSVERAEAGVVAAQAPPDKPATKLALEDFQPRSMLVVPEHPTPRARFPVIDVHTHVSRLFGQQRVRDPQVPASAAVFKHLDGIVGVMDQLNIQTLNNLTGGYGETLKQYVSDLQKRYPGRFLNCVQPAYEKIREANYPAWQAEELQRAKEAGAVGLKINKALGLYLRENVREGPLVKIDDPRFDPMWAAPGMVILRERFSAQGRSAARA